MKRILKNTIVVLLLFQLFTCTTVPLSIETPLGKEIGEFLNEKAFKGSVLVALDGEIILQKGFGFADKKKNIKNRANTRFLIASITKQFTATAVMLLQQQGLLKLDDRVTEYLDYPAANNVTIENLLTHTSGVPEYTDGKFIGKLKEGISYTLVELFNLFKDKQVFRKPGVKWEYCNSNYILLGLIIEKVSGLSYEQFFDENIFKPLKLKNTKLRDDYWNVRNMATGYYETKSYSAVPKYGTSVALSAGGMSSTVEDLYLWHSALLGNEFLTEESKKAMFSSSILHDGRETGYGYGWAVEENNRIISHGGSITGFASFIYRDLEKNLCVILLSNDYVCNTFRLAKSIVKQLETDGLKG